MTRKRKPKIETTKPTFQTQLIRELRDINETLKEVRAEPAESIQKLADIAGWFRMQAERMAQERAHVSGELEKFRQWTVNVDKVCTEKVVAMQAELDKLRAEVKPSQPAEHRSVFEVIFGKSDPFAHQKMKR